MSPSFFEAIRRRPEFENDEDHMLFFDTLDPLEIARHFSESGGLAQ